ncbi:hypothetical protein BOSEA31B_10220 [Hyphomicrobiales bacterium]|nr:hypothetical protein BOSEA31B_10220 [Hyphomicrobiales bacterium]CAH1701899.1 hypothetical protein BOSEA1005_21598 [Hyphomicrobiales bacterium]CAI0346056.1 hypothetical protein BO1005MUT1_470214 [Hyphomicrobiales bacterium]
MSTRESGGIESGNCPAMSSQLAGLPGCSGCEKAGRPMKKASGSSACAAAGCKPNAARRQAAARTDSPRRIGDGVLILARLPGKMAEIRLGPYLRPDAITVIRISALAIRPRLTMRGACDTAPQALNGKRRGRLAQLVERLVYTEDVGGSSPSLPTTLHGHRGQPRSRPC